MKGLGRHEGSGHCLGGRWGRGGGWGERKSEREGHRDHLNDEEGIDG